MIRLKKCYDSSQNKLWFDLMSVMIQVIYPWFESTLQGQNSNFKLTFNSNESYAWFKLSFKNPIF